MINKLRSIRGWFRVISSSCKLTLEFYNGPSLEVLTIQKVFSSNCAPFRKCCFRLRYSNFPRRLEHRRLLRSHSGIDSKWDLSALGTLVSLDVLNLDELLLSLTVWVEMSPP